MAYPWKIKKGECVWRAQLWWEASSFKEDWWQKRSLQRKQTRSVGGGGMSSLGSGGRLGTRWWERNKSLTQRSAHDEVVNLIWWAEVGLSIKSGVKARGLILREAGIVSRNGGHWLPVRAGRGLERRLEQLLGIPGSSWRFKRTAKPAFHHWTHGTEIIFPKGNRHLWWRCIFIYTYPTWCSIKFKEDQLDNR